MQLREAEREVLHAEQELDGLVKQIVGWKETETYAIAYKDPEREKRAKDVLQRLQEHREATKDRIRGLRSNLSEFIQANVDTKASLESAEDMTSRWRRASSQVGDKNTEQSSN